MMNDSDIFQRRNMIQESVNENDGRKVEEFTCLTHG